MYIKPDDDGNWTCPSREFDVSLCPIETCIQGRRDTIFNFVKDRSISQKCMEQIEAVKNILVGATF